MLTPNFEILKTRAEFLHKDSITKENGCIEFGRFKDELGYGWFQFCYNKSKYILAAHRASYILSNRIDIKTEQVVRHTCDNPSCINPEHLIIGTHNDNVQDRVKRNRSAVGSRNGRYIHGKHVKTYPGVIRKPMRKVEL